MVGTADGRMEGKWFQIPESTTSKCLPSPCFRFFTCKVVGMEVSLCIDQGSGDQTCCSGERPEWWPCGAVSCMRKCLNLVDSSVDSYRGRRRQLGGPGYNGDVSDPNKGLWDMRYGPCPDLVSVVAVVAEVCGLVIETQK